MNTGWNLTWSGVNLLPNAVEVVKKAAVEAVEAGKPVNLLFGEVISASPLKIQVDQKAIYTEKNAGVGPECHGLWSGYDGKPPDCYN